MTLKLNKETLQVINSDSQNGVDGASGDACPIPKSQGQENCFTKKCPPPNCKTIKNCKFSVEVCPKEKPPVW